MRVKYKGSLHSKIRRMMYMVSPYRAPRATQAWAFSPEKILTSDQSVTFQARQSSPHHCLSVYSPIRGWCKALKPSLIVSPPAKSSRETCCLRTLKVKDRGLICAAETIYITIQLRSRYTISRRCLLSITDKREIEVMSPHRSHQLGF